jgi:hypothetical protein
MLLRHFGGDGINEPQDGARVSIAFFLFDAPTIVALAPSLAVILRHGVDAGLGMLLDPLQDSLNGKPEYLGIGQAELRRFASPLAAN